MDSGPESNGTRPYHLRLTALCQRLSRQGHLGMAVNPSSLGRNFSTSGVSSARELVLLSYWKRSIPHRSCKVLSLGRLSRHTSWVTPWHTWVRRS